MCSARKRFRSLAHAHECKSTCSHRDTIKSCAIHAHDHASPWSHPPRPTRPTLAQFHSQKGELEASWPWAARSWINPSPISMVRRDGFDYNTPQPPRLAGGGQHYGYGPKLCDGGVVYSDAHLGGAEKDDQNRCCPQFERSSWPPIRPQMVAACRQPLPSMPTLSTQRYGN